MNPQLFLPNQLKKGSKTRKNIRVPLFKIPNKRQQYVSDPANFWSGKRIVQHQDPGVTDLHPHKTKMYCLALGHRSDKCEN